MEILFELIFELIFEGTIEASKSKKVPKIIRYPLVALIVLFFSFVIGILLFLGVECLSRSIIGGIFIILVGIYLLVMSILKFRDIYIKKKD